MGSSQQKNKPGARRANKTNQEQFSKSFKPSTSAGLGNPSPRRRKLPAWSAYVLLSVGTIACLAPFSGKAFHVDDTLFIWAAKQITKQPLNPYGFELIWDMTRVPMSEVTQNPPLASYYAALVGELAGWSERALHLAFLIPALVVVLGTYRLAQRFTESPLLAALATLLTPGFLVSATSVMCDTTMLAIWMLAALLWVEGEEDRKSLYLVGSGLLIGACALTKYFGIGLIPLLLVYSLARRRRLGTWIFSLLIPVVMLVIYELWTADLYGQGLLTRAAEFADSQRIVAQVPYLGKVLVGASFAGGCALTAVLFAFLLWSRKELLSGAILAICAGASILLGWVGLGMQLGHAAALAARQQHWLLIGTQLVLCIGGGISILALAISDFWKHRDAKSLFLTLWICGTFVFAGFLNWTVNARSVLPLIPATGILLARRIGKLQWVAARKELQVIAVLAASGALSLWIAFADARLANAARQAATVICQNTRRESGTIWFEGHWGFQYYMESCGAQPMDILHPVVHNQDLLVIPENNVQIFPIRPEMADTVNSIELGMPYWATTAGSWVQGFILRCGDLCPLPSDQFDPNATQSFA